MESWSELKAAEKARIIQFAIQNGVSDIKTIKDTYNIYAKDSLANIDYNMAAAKASGFGSNGNGHYPDVFKKPNHPTFSDESIYHSEETPGGRWRGNTYEPSEFVLNQQGSWNQFLRGFYNQEQETGAVPIFNGGIMLPEVTVASQYKEGGKAHTKHSGRGRFTENLYNRIVPIPATMPHGPIIGGITQYLKNSDSAAKNFIDYFNLEDAVQAMMENPDKKYMAERLEPFLLEDLKDLYLGMPQRSSMFEPSKYKPSNATEDIYYHSPVMENTLAPYFISALNDIKTGNIKPSLDKFGSGNYFDVQSVTPSGNAVTILPGLGHATLGNGYDNGEYVSYYDKWNIGNFTPNTSFILDQYYKSPNIYGRIYLDDYYNIPEDNRGTTFLPEVMVTPKYKNGGKIYIKPSKRGTFTAAASKHGKSVQAFAAQVLAHKENYSPAMVKKANFARNAASWKHSTGGPLYPFSFQKNLYLKVPTIRYADGGDMFTPNENIQNVQMWLNKGTRFQKQRPGTVNIQNITDRLDPFGADTQYIWDSPEKESYSAFRRNPNYRAPQVPSIQTEKQVFTVAPAKASNVNIKTTIPSINAFIKKPNIPGKWITMGGAGNPAYGYEMLHLENSPYYGIKYFSVPGTINAGEGSSYVLDSTVLNIPIQDLYSRIFDYTSRYGKMESFD